MEGVGAGGGDEDELRQLQPKQTLAGGQVYCERAGAAALSRFADLTAAAKSLQPPPRFLFLFVSPRRGGNNGVLLIRVTTARHGGSTPVSSKAGRRLMRRGKGFFFFYTITLRCESPSDWIKSCTGGTNRSCSQRSFLTSHR